MNAARKLFHLIIFLAFALSACGTPNEPSEESERRPSQTLQAATRTDVPTIPPAPTRTPTPAPPTATSTEESFPFTWEGSWNVWVGHPKVSIVNTVEFIVDGETVRAEWYEGSRLVYLDGRISQDGAVITGFFWNSDVDVLETRLVLDPNGAFFTGDADSEAGLGQFCGTRTDPNRPSPCRAQTP